MTLDLLPFLRCPSCERPTLTCEAIDARDGVVRDGVVWCRTCRAWYPIESGVLELLCGRLAYHQDRERFWRMHRRALEAVGLREDGVNVDAEPDTAAQRLQQSHFDWYAHNEAQTYAAYEATPFWQAVDDLTFERWRPLIADDSWLLDVGCAQGRSAARFKDVGCRIIGFDVSKQLVGQAAERCRREEWRSRATFLVADGSRFPFVDTGFDAVLVYGVLHHVPSPAVTCAEIARVLKPGGWFLGSENNRTVFRAVFELVQRVWPLWHEEAGSQPLISRSDFERWFAPSRFSLDIRTMVFLPPHLLNLVASTSARACLRTTDLVIGAIPALRDHGGLIVVTGRRPAACPESHTPHTRHSETGWATAAGGVFR